MLLDGSQPLYLDIYREADRPLRQLSAKSNFYCCITLLPNEGGVIMFDWWGDLNDLTNCYERIATALPLLGALAIGAQRILLILQQI